MGSITFFYNLSWVQNVHCLSSSKPPFESIHLNWLLISGDFSSFTPMLVWFWNGLFIMLIDFNLYYTINWFSLILWTHNKFGNAFFHVFYLKYHQTTYQNSQLKLKKTLPLVRYGTYKHPINCDPAPKYHYYLRKLCCCS